MSQGSPIYSLIHLDGSCQETHRNIIPDEPLIALLKLMIFNRVLDRRMLLLQRQGRLGFYLTSTGEEAITIGAAYCLKSNDPIFLSYRELGSVLFRGVPLDDILNQFIGNTQNLNKGRQMPVDHGYKDYYIPSVSAPVGTQLSHACGYAYAAQYQKTGQVALAFLGEGTSSSNDFHAALNLSGVLNTPVIFVIRNNGYALSTPESAQTAAESLASRAHGYGIKGVQIDGNDILMVVKTVQEAVQRAREGRGPTLIEAMTYRLGAHSCSDDPSAYRSEEETHQWKPFGALVRLIQHANWRRIWTDEMYDQTVEEAEDKISESISKCEKWPPPQINTLFEDVYATMPLHIREQRDQYLAFLSRQKESEF